MVLSWCSSLPSCCLPSSLASSAAAWTAASSPARPACSVSSLVSSAASPVTTVSTAFPALWTAKS